MGNDKSEFYEGKKGVWLDRSAGTSQDGTVMNRQGRVEGYVSKEGHISRGLFDTFQELIKDGKVYANNISHLFEQEWGYVDNDGNVRQTGIFGDKIIGRVNGRNVAGALAHFVIMFKNFEDKILDLENDFNHSSNHASFSNRISNMLRNLENLNALGDFQNARSRLNTLKHQAENAQNHNKHAKQALYDEVNRLRFTDNFREAADRVKEIQAEWKEIGNAGDYEDGLWTNFRAACDDFFRRKKEFNEQRERNFNENARAKTSLCDKAEGLRDSEDWRDTSARFKQMIEDWKGIGFAGRDKDEGLWQRFNSAKSKFFERQNQHFNQVDRERQQNASAKAELCSEAESIQYSTDWKDTSQRMRAMQDEWKEIGSAGKDQNDALWNRFIAAKNKFYSRKSAYESANAQAKDSLCNEAERIQYSDDWKDVSARFRQMQDEWKEIGFAGVDNDSYWNRFNNARQYFRQRQSDEFERRADAKRDLISRCDYYDCGNDWSSGNAYMREAMEEWKSIGHAGNQDADLWEQFQRVQQNYRDARQEFFDNRPSR